MPITIEIWEDSGPLSVGIPSVRQKVDNLGWKNSGLDETYPYYDYPVQRPYGTSIFELSFNKYYYFKMSGTWTGVVTPKFELIGGPTEITTDRIYYRWTSTYDNPPNDSPLSGSYFDPSNPPEWNPIMTTTGEPRNAGTYYPTLTSGTSYTTGYLVTQLYSIPGPWTAYGNISSDSSFVLKCTLTEDLVLLNYHQYDDAHMTWSNN